MRGKMYRRILVCMVSLAFLTGCQTMKSDIGTALGGVFGAAAGSKIGKGNGRIFAVLGGAAIGALVGREIGKYLEDQDQLALAEATVTAATTGGMQTFNNPESGISGSVKVVEEETNKTEMTIPVLEDRVSKLPPFEAVGEAFEAISTVNVRGGPGTNYIKVGKIQETEVIEVAGKVTGTPWYFISEGGIGTGFIHSNYLKKISLKELTSKSAKMRANKPVGDVVEKTVNVDQECKTLEQIVVLADGSEKKEKITGCRGPNGWDYS